MTDVSLNGLKVKTDSLPNDWYVSLINPKSDEPAEIMTVAKFAEMFLENNSVLTKNDEGVNGSLSASKSYKLVNIEEINDLNSIPDLGNPGLRIFNFRPSALNTPPKNDNSSILFHIDRGYYGSAGYYYSQLAFQSNGVFFREYHGNIDWGWKKLLFEETALQSNALTDTISDNYSILPPPPPQIACQTIQNQQVQASNLRYPLCRKQTTWMVQLQLKVNQTRCRSSTFGLSTKLERQYLNCRKKINILNKSSRLTA
ncbi:hypothetical protein [Parabacteroides goldsteinii]|uniref:hypothetical protein n=1 Tax=Parabacteroides goldsteinii TaxID=328812 RepID=UPI0026728B01|nr:hypothetical protein [Parabacteroides goldsteinii]